MATTTVIELETLVVDSATTNATRLVSTPSRESPTRPTALSKSRAVIVIGQLIGLQLFTSFCNGIVVLTSIFYLTAGSCLMLARLIANVVSIRPVVLAANILLVASALSCGLAQTRGELIAFCGLQGVTSAMAVLASVLIILTSVEIRWLRNLGFACLGFLGPLRFLIGLVLGGVFVDSVGWRPAFYLAAAASFVLCVIGVWVLPRDARPKSRRTIGKQLAFETDWVGTVISSTGLATLSYALAMLSSDINNIRRASNISLLVIGVVSVPAFVWWMNYQRNSNFTSICVMILLTSAVSNSIELFSSLFFQQVQGNSALGASLRILPALVMAVLTNISMGYFVNRLPVMWVVLISSALSAISPLLMAVVDPEWPYWYMAFIAQILQPLSPDVLFTVGLLVISAVFPPHTQALGGAVFNTCVQLGTSIGLTVTSVIADSRTAASGDVDKMSPSALMAGYRAVFWALFAWMVFVCLVGALGLRKVGKIGAKQD
ncbi:MFS general substrate transporter [Dothidotthia symphoricarpi CBS 119687]|uniref:MFS general substrate transporter n=1 Tax=Dothidotthia symphoricarpi CBS 119687 TaxID=1392245 RepID=A0A6A6APL6_9PLEO|nr:MFS general substrate transporter [Dothidotthia symphoricarpi CBS 119687]KAF2132451.1 MFS general substrate transporter [Dothidotthia symphoricarpi CBS 119687]